MTISHDMMGKLMQKSIDSSFEYNKFDDNDVRRIIRTKITAYFNKISKGEVREGLLRAEEYTEKILSFINEGNNK